MICYHPGGGTDLERGYGDVRPWRPPFHASPAARKGPILSKRVSSQDPLLRKLGNFSLYSLNFHPNFSSQASKFSAHKPPNLEIFRSQAPLFRSKCQFASPTLQKSGQHTPTWKKLSVPPLGYHQINYKFSFSCSFTFMLFINVLFSRFRTYSELQHTCQTHMNAMHTSSYKQNICQLSENTKLHTNKILIPLHSLFMPISVACIMQSMYAYLNTFNLSCLQKQKSQKMFL